MFLKSLLFFTEGQLIYNVVPISLYSKVIQLYLYRHLFFIFFSIVVYHRILNIVHGAIQENFIV